MPDYKIIDTHVHAYPRAIAEKVAGVVGRPGEKRDPNEVTAEGIIAAQQKAGIALSLNLPVATRAEHVPSTNAFAKNLPPGLISFASLHPDTPDKGVVLRQIKADGFKGLKFHPEFQDFYLDDPRMLGCWEEMASLGLVAYFHAGGDRAYAPPYHTTPKVFRKFIENFPTLKVVAAHMGGYQMWYESETDLCGSNIYLDLSQIFVFGEVGQITRMIRKHGADKILFATDSPWREPIDDVKAFLSLPLTEEERELIFHQNAERLLELC